MYLIGSRNIYCAIKYYYYRYFTEFYRERGETNYYITMRRKNMLLLISTTNSNYDMHTGISYALTVVNNFKITGVKSALEAIDLGIDGDIEAYDYIPNTYCRRCTGNYEDETGVCTTDNYWKKCAWAYVEIKCVNDINNVFDMITISNIYLLDNLVYHNMEGCILTVDKILARYEMPKHWYDLCINMVKSKYDGIVGEN